MTLGVRIGASLKACVVLVVLMAAEGCGSSLRVAPGVNASAIRSIKVGMTQEQVTKILGVPLAVRPWGADELILDYAIPGWAGRSSALWVHLREGSVTTIQAKIHPVVGVARAVYEEGAHHPTFETGELDDLFNRGS